MLSSISNLFSMRRQAKSYKASAAIHDANALGIRKAAEAKASGIEEAARRNMSIAGENLARGRTNQRAAVSTVANKRAESGFSGGTSDAAAQQTQASLDIQLANLAQEASIASLNSWQSAIDTREQGDLQARQQEALAEQYRFAAKATRTAMVYSGISTAVSAAFGAYKGFSAASARNDSLNQAFDSSLASLNSQLNSGSISQADFDAAHAANLLTLQESLTSPTYAATLSALNYGGSGFNIMNSFSPYTATLSANPNTKKNNYGGSWSVLLGNIPYQTPRSDSFFVTNF